MKRVLCILLTVVVVMTSVVPVMAAVSEPSVSPCYAYIQSISAGLSINETFGLTSCNGTCIAYGGDSIKLTCSLQRHNGSSWVTIKSWSTTTSAQTVALSKNYAVYSGYTYRVRVTCSVYNSAGTLLESGVIYSKQVTY